MHSTMATLAGSAKDLETSAKTKEEKIVKNEKQNFKIFLILEFLLTASLLIYL